MAIRSCGVTDVGKRRDHNEDIFLIDEHLGLYMVCDGMGGHAAGEVASRIAAETVKRFLEATNSDEDLTWPFELDESLSMEGNRLRTAIRLANRHVLHAIQEKHEYRGMGTTIATVTVFNQMAHLGHVGDSRIYLIRAGELKQVTEDHSWIGEQMRQGILSKDEASRHPLRNVITRALGSREDVEVDVQEQVLQPDDRLLLCSDGLTTMLNDEEISRTVAEAGGDIDKACRRLVDKANDRGGEDNVTVVMVQYVKNG